MTERVVVKRFLVLALVTGVAGSRLFAAENVPAEQACTETAIAKIQSLGGKVTRDKNSPGGPSYQWFSAEPKSRTLHWSISIG